MSDSDVGDQQMLITVSTNFQNFVDVPFISTCGRYPVHERFPLTSFSSFAFNHPGQCNGFQLILSHNMTHTLMYTPTIPSCQSLYRGITSLSFQLSNRAVELQSNRSCNYTALMKRRLDSTTEWSGLLTQTNAMAVGVLSV